MSPNRSPAARPFVLQQALARRLPFPIAALRCLGMGVAGVVGAASAAQAESQPATAQAHGGTATLPPITVNAFGEGGLYQPTMPVLSATRLADSLQDVPQTVDVIPEASLRDRGATSLTDALAYTPGVTTSAGKGTREQFLIRGFSAQADTYVDGLRDGSAAYRDNFNLEQIEVVKGPAGVLYGRGSAGGLINMVTKAPLSTPRAEAAATVGSYGQRRATVDINQPISEQVLFRLNAVSAEADSFRDQVWSHKRGLSLASTLRLAPGATLDLRAQHLRDRRVFDAGIPGFEGRPAPVPRSTYYGSRDPGSTDSGSSEDNAFSADLMVDLGDGMRLRNTLGFRTLGMDRSQTSIDRLLLNTRVPSLRMAREGFVTRQQDLTNRLEFMLKRQWLGLTHEILVGNEMAQETRDTVSRSETLRSSYDIALFNPVLKAPPRSLASVRRDGNYDTDTASIYLQDQVRFDSHWVGLVGLRKDWLQRDFANRVGKDYGRKDDFLSPRVGIVYQPSREASYYASATRSYQPGSNSGVIDPGNSIQPPEITTNYEVGSKYLFNDGRLQFGASLFQLVKENVPTRDPSHPSGTQLYIGEITSRGVELSSVGDLGDGWNLQGGVSWIDAFVSRSNNTVAPAITPTPPATPLKGKHAANAPKFGASLWAVKRLDAHWRVGVGLRHRAQAYASTTNAVVLPAYTVVDAGLFHERGPWSLSLTARNLTDRPYYDSSTNDLGIQPGTPRSLQLTARYLF